MLDSEIRKTKGSVLKSPKIVLARSDQSFHHLLESYPLCQTILYSDNISV